MAAPAQTTSDVPEPSATADPAALAAFVSRRAGRVLAYLRTVTAPADALGATGEAFASYRLARAADPDAEAPATTLLRATRRAAAVHAENPHRPDGRERSATRTGACTAMPRLLVAWTEARLPEPDVARLVEHLQGCPDCRALRDAFDRAELGYRAGDSTDPDGSEVGVITTAMAQAGGGPAEQAAPAPSAAASRESTTKRDASRPDPAEDPRAPTGPRRPVADTPAEAAPKRRRIDGRGSATRATGVPARGARTSGEPPTALPDARTGDAATPARR
ncbi:zf-HC2 domain-containing protein, partial [Patulibacter sp.]|uniref:zf-HC2 domain-containing protein n=1 Tax=Patulibacter sp. TaxID=1912859 RepID=UPI0027238692